MKSGLFLLRNEPLFFFCKKRKSACGIFAAFQVRVQYAKMKYFYKCKINN